MSSLNTWRDCISLTYGKIFGRTPTKERLNDIQRQATFLNRATGLEEMREKTGNLLGSLLQLTNEMDWNPEKLLEENIKLIKRRALQYRSLGRRKRVAILGGAFNPVTNGHIEVLKFVLDCSGKFDEAWLMPCYKHMYGKEMVAPEHRLAMCHLAATIDSRIRVIDFEIEHQLEGETYKVVKALKDDPYLKEYYDISFIIGQDNANTFHKWVNYEYLEKEVSFVIVPRKGEKRDEGVVWYLKGPHIYMNPDNAIPEISSTQIREYLKKIDDFPETYYPLINKYLDSTVFNYITNHKLYKQAKRKKANVSM